MSTIAWNPNELVSQYNYLGSGHFFDKDTMHFFQSRVTENYIRLNDTEALFITTEKGPNGIRKATVRKAILAAYVRDSDGRKCEKINIETLSAFNTLSLYQAKKAMLNYAK